jgi:fucose permease
MWGFLTSLSDILIPHLKAIFDLSYARVMLVQFAFFSAYFLFSLPWGRILNAIGYQHTMVVRLQVAANPYVVVLGKPETASSRLDLTQAFNSLGTIWKHRNLMFGALGIFAYVGAEVSIGSFFVNYLGQADVAGLSAQTAAGYVCFYWAGAMVGRFLGAALMERIPVHVITTRAALVGAASFGLEHFNHGSGVAA